MNAYYVNYIIKGQMYFKLKGKRYVAHAGQMVLLDCRQEHEYGALNQSCTFIYIHFRGAFLTPITANLQKMGLVFDSRGQELTLFERIMKLIKNNRLFINDEKLSLLLFQLINDLVFSQESFLRSEKLSSEVIQAEDYIEQNCSHKLTLQEVSSQLFISKSKLAQEFKQQLGLSFHRVVEDIRLQKAKNLLVSRPELEIAEVAFSCGYYDSSHLYKALKQDVHLTPKQFRKNYTL